MLFRPDLRTPSEQRRDRGRGVRRGSTLHERLPELAHGLPQLRRVGRLDTIGRDSLAQVAAGRLDRPQHLGGALAQMRCRIVGVGVVQPVARHLERHPATPRQAHLDIAIDRPGRGLPLEHVAIEGRHHAPGVAGRGEHRLLLRAPRDHGCAVVLLRQLEQGDDGQRVEPLRLLRPAHHRRLRRQRWIDRVHPVRHRQEHVAERLDLAPVLEVRIVEHDRDELALGLLLRRFRLQRELPHPHARFLAHRPWPAVVGPHVEPGRHLQHRRIPVEPRGPQPGRLLGAILRHPRSHGQQPAGEAPRERLRVLRHPPQKLGVGIGLGKDGGCGAVVKLRARDLRGAVHIALELIRRDHLADKAADERAVRRVLEIRVAQGR